LVIDWHLAEYDYSPILIGDNSLEGLDIDWHLAEYDIPALPIGNDQPSYGVYAS